jgi:STE24 endopeptidase
MQPLLILVLLMAFWQPLAAPPVLSASWTLGSVLVGLLLCRTLAELPSLYLAFQLRLSPSRRWRWLWMYYRWRQIHLGLLVAMYAYGLFGLHWSTFVTREMGLGGTILLDEFGILLPFLLGLILSWDSFYRVERALHQTGEEASLHPFWTRPGYVVYQIRQHLGLVLLPLGIFLAMQETAQWLWPQLMKSDPQATLTQMIPQVSITMAISLMVLALMPWLLTKIFITAPLPEGPLRDRLTATAERLRFPFTDICVWNTRLGVANAMVTGFLPRPRYVLLSDLLLEELTPDEVEAVLCHEIAHLRHRHIPLYLLFMGLSVAVLTQALHLGMRLCPGDIDRLLSSPNLSPPAAIPWTVWLFFGGSLGLVGGYIRLVFGALSRSCERQADVFACKSLCLAPPAPPPPELAGLNGHVPKPATVPAGLVQGVPVFVSALEKVARLNGIPFNKPSWRHGSIARRVTFLQQLAARPDQEPRQQRRWLVFKILLLTVLAVTSVVLSLLGSNPLSLLE